MTNETLIADTIAETAAQKYVWPGGYALAAVMADGETLCAPCTTANIDEIRSELNEPADETWRVVGWTHTGETDDEMVCAHCKNTIGDPRLDTIETPGKLEGESRQTESLYMLTLEDGHDDEIGETDYMGWFARLTHALAIIEVDTQGFVHGHYFSSAEELETTWAAIVSDHDHDEHDNEGWAK